MAVDIGGTKMDIAFLDQNGSFYTSPERVLVPFDRSGVAIPGEILDLLEPYVDQAKKELPNFLGIGLSVCGNINEITGEAVLVANLYWRNIPIGRMAEDQFNVPILPATDVRMALIAELLWGKAINCKHVAWMTLGTGFGGYLFLNGQIYGGYHGFAGNLGHNIYDEIHGELCGCGQRGCFESFVAGPAIASQGRKAVEDGKSQILSDLCLKESNLVTTKMVFEAELMGDQASKEIIDGVIRKLGISLSSMVNLLDLEMIILGGGVLKGSPDFLDRIDKRVRGFLMTEEAKRDLKIVRESFDNSALVGAGASVFLKNGILSI